MQKRAIKTREKILKKALLLFAKYGFNGTTVDLIAEKAEVNKQRIYAYYQNKAKLFETCLRTTFEMVLDGESKTFTKLTEQDTKRMTRVIMDHFLDQHTKHPHFWRLIAWANLEVKYPADSTAHVNRNRFQHLRKLYQHGQQDGTFSPQVSFESYIFTLLGITYFYYSNQKTLAGTLTPEIFTEQGRAKLTDECLEMLVG